MSRLYTIRVIRFDNEKIKEIKEFAEKNEIRILEVDEEEVPNYIYDELRYRKMKINPDDFGKNYCDELGSYTTDIVEHCVKDIPVEDILEIMENSDFTTLSEGELYRIRKNMSDKLLNILKQIVNN